MRVSPYSEEEKDERQRIREDEKDEKWSILEVMRKTQESLSSIVDVLRVVVENVVVYAANDGRKYYFELIDFFRSF